MLLYHCIAKKTRRRVYKSLGNNYEETETRKGIMPAVVRLGALANGTRFANYADDDREYAAICQSVRRYDRYYCVCHIPGLVCQDRPPMNIFLEKKDDSIRLAIRPRIVDGRGSGDCQQRVTSGCYFATPCAVSRLQRQVSPHINQQPNNTPVSSFLAEHVRRARTGNRMFR